MQSLNVHQNMSVKEGELQFSAVVPGKERFSEVWCYAGKNF